MFEALSLSCCFAVLTPVSSPTVVGCALVLAEAGLIEEQKKEIAVPTFDAVGMHPEVKAVFEEARAKVCAEPDSASSWRKLGALFDAHDLLRQAEICYRRAHELDPKDFSAIYLLAIVSDQLGHPLERTVALFNAAILLRPDYAPVYLNMGNALAREGEIGQARDAYERALSINENFYAAHRRIGQILLITDELDLAREHLLKAWEGAPDDSEINASLAQVCMRLGDRSLAREYAERTRGMSPSLAYRDRVREEVMAMALSTHSRLGRAKQAYQNDELDRAIDELKTILRLHPTQAEAHVMLGGILLQKGQAKDALLHLEQAVAHSPQDADKRLVYGQALLSSMPDNPAALKKAVQTLRSAVQLSPKDDEIREFFAIALARRGRHDQAIAQFERAAASGRQLSEAGYSLWGSVLGVEGRLQEAYERFRSAFELIPESAELCFNLAVALDQLGHTKEAIAMYERSIELGTTMPAKQRADALR